MKRPAVTLGPKPVPIWAHPIEAVAFDMDGLLVNTEEIYTEVGSRLLARRGKLFTADLKRSIMGLPGQQAFELIIQQEQLSDSVEALARESDQIFDELLPRRLRLLPGALDLLAELDRRDMRRCVATSSSRHFAYKVLRLVEILERVDFVLTALDVDQGKPNPDIYLAAAERMQVHVSNMMVLEDSHHGSRAGVLSGACTIAVPSPHSDDHDFSGVHYQAQSLEDPGLLSILQG